MPTNLLLNHNPNNPMKPEVIAAPIKTKVTGIIKSEEEFKLTKVKNSCRFGLLYTFLKFS